MTKPCVHFVGFRGEEYWSAVKIWGRPGMVHRKWDLRARRDIDPDTDLVIFAKGDDSQQPSTMSGDDLDERWLIGGEFYGRK